MPKVLAISEINKKLHGNCRFLAIDRDKDGVHFLCVCGRILKLKQYSNLFVGKHNNCGCIPRGKQKPRKEHNIEYANKIKPEDCILDILEIFWHKNGTKCKCRCQCGNFSYPLLCAILKGRTKSCGCIQKKCNKYVNNIRTIYRSYSCMIHRCYTESDASFSNYGGRGVTVCDEWRNDYQAFLDWSLANGWAPNLELDKDIKGTGLLYSPDMCLWVTHQDNMNYLDSAKIHNYNGEMMTLYAVSLIVKIDKVILHRRMANGINLQEAIAIGPEKISTTGPTKYHTHNGETLTLRKWAFKLGVSYPLLRFRVNGKGLSIGEAISLPIRTINKTYLIQ